MWKRGCGRVMPTAGRKCAMVKPILNRIEDLKIEDSEQDVIVESEDSS